MHIENTRKNSTLKTDPYSICVELVFFNLKVKNPTISHSLRLRIAKYSSTVKLFLRYVKEFCDLAKIIDRYSIDVSTYVELTHPQQRVYNPKYFFKKETFAKLDQTLKNVRTDKTKNYVINSISTIIQRCKELKCSTLTDYININQDLEGKPKTLYSECLNRYKEFYLVLCILSRRLNISYRDSGLESLGRLFFNKESFSRECLKVYNILTQHFGEDTQKIVDLINDEIRKG